MALGWGLSFLASVAPGLLAIAVLLVIMNWFFHNIYWAGWIGMHNRRKKELTQAGGRSESAVFPNVEGLAAQAVAGAFVVGSYYLARRGCARTAADAKGRLAVVPSAPTDAPGCIVPDCAGCEVHPRDRGARRGL